MLSSACRRHALVVAMCALFACPALGQDDDPAKLLEEFIHYTLIAKPDLASGYAQQLFQSGLSDANLAETIDDSRELLDRFERAISWAHRLPELEDIAAELERRLNEGRLDLARDADRIDRAISMLTGNQRMKLQARRLLAEAGEYAVPYLLRKIVEGGDERLRSASGDMLVEIGRQAVTPLCVSLAQLDERNQRYVCGVLGEIGLPHAAPYLLELAMGSSTAAATRDAAVRAFRQVGGLEGDLSQQFERLGQQYFNEAESLVAFAFEPTNNVWNYDPLFGLEATPVPTAVFSEVKAMQTASRALRIDPGNKKALSLFVAANLKRANELPGGAADPIYGENRYSPDFYATVFGTEICMDVLAMGIDRLDTPLVRDAIAALADTTGGANLFAGADGRQPLLEALRYPDRRVQYEAALTLGHALPDQRFSGDVSVVPLLASAVRTGDTAYAVVIARDEENRRIAATRLDDLGFTIIAAGASFEAVRSEMAIAVGVDLVVVHAADADDAVYNVAEVHGFPKTAATPLIVVASAVDVQDLKRAFRDDIRVRVARARVSDMEFAESLDEVMLRAAGGRMTEAEAEAYAIDAIITLRDIAISRNTSYTIGDAESALIQALVTRSGGLRLMVADILSLLDSAQAQQVLFDAALAAEGDEQIELLDRVAESVKRFGDRSERRHIDALLDLVANSGGATAEAAARVHGSLVLPPATAIDLIP